MTVDELLREIESCSTDDLRRVREAVQQRLAQTADEAEREEEFAKYLEAKGVITRPDPADRLPASQRAPVVYAEGEPVSETLIRERR